MAHLAPLPLRPLASRLLAELEGGGPVYDLPARRIVRGGGGRDLAVGFHGARASTPVGPAAGPQSQLAQNLALSFLGGGRIFELKTVQIQDQLAVPRPCIDMRGVGYNVEWSQELRLEQSLDEYVKGSMLVDLMAKGGLLELEPGFDASIFDMSVGYDLAGVRSEPVQAFMRGMRDARVRVDELRSQIPSRWAHLRDLDFRTEISDTVTLSTFHGCPPDEIERIAAYLLEEVGVHTVVKLNPVLLGPVETRRILGDVLGYPDAIPDSAFEDDTRWSQAVDFVGRLQEVAARAGRGLGIKLTNTLIVENPGDFLPASERVRYLSGPPLHVLAIQLVARFREVFGDAIPISFSAGIDRANLADAASLGLVPITACSDLLRPQGYARMHGWFAELGKRMDAVGARSLDAWVLRGQGEGEAALCDVEPDGPRRAACVAALAGGGDLEAVAGPELHARWLSRARVRNAARYAERVLADPRYAAAAHARPPKKVGSDLHLLDCLTCDKCVPVCPNDANFTYDLPQVELPVVRLSRGADGALAARTDGAIRVEKRHQIANYADFCNECGNCDVFCPEDGGPYVVKPRFFGTLAAFDADERADGLFVHRRGGPIHGRSAGHAYRLAPLDDGLVAFAGEGFDLVLDLERPEQAAGRLDAGVDVDSVLDGPITWVNAR